MPGSEILEPILQAEGNRCLPLAGYILKTSGHSLPFIEGHQETVKVLRRSFAVRNAFLFKELRTVLKLFQSAGIEAIVLKGAALDAFVYPPGVRHFRDIDLLIRKKEIDRTLDILSTLGFQPRRDLCHHDAAEFQHEVSYRKEGPISVTIQPHWMLVSPFSFSGTIDMGGIWERAQKKQIADVEMQVLSPEDFLFHLCIHLFQHYKRGSWLTSCCDIAALCRYYEGKIQWEEFLNLVIDAKMALPVQHAISKTIELFQPPIPSFVEERLLSCRPDEREKRAFELLLSIGHEKSGANAHAILPFFTMPKFSMKLRYLTRKIFPSREFMMMRYAITNPRRLPFFYLMRWKDMFSFGVKSMGKLLPRIKGQWSV